MKLFYISIIMFIFGTFLMANDSQPIEKPTPTITIGSDDDKAYAGRRRGKGQRGRRRGGNGLR